MKKGLRHKPLGSVPASASPALRPDEEGIKTSERVMDYVRGCGPALRPDEEGIKTLAGGEWMNPRMVRP